MNISKYLSKQFGGKWTYDHICSWWCNDDKRNVNRVSSCICDDVCDHTPYYYLYGDVTPKLLHKLVANYFNNKIKNKNAIKS